MTLHVYVTGELVYSTVHAHHDVLTRPCEHLYSVYLCKHHLKNSCGCVVAASAIREKSMSAVLLQIKNVCSSDGSLYLFPASSYPFPSLCTCLPWVQRSVGHVPHIHVWCPIIHYPGSGENSFPLTAFSYFLGTMGAKRTRHGHVSNSFRSIGQVQCPHI